MPTYVWVFMAIAAVILLISRLKGLGTGSKHIKNELYQYKEKQLMTPTELKFFTLLENSCPELRFHAQVCMGALLEPRVPRSSGYFFKSRNKIASKIVDFVAQDRATGKVVALIELDDPTHDSEEAKRRDAERDEYTASAGFRTVRWNVSNQPDVMAIRHTLLKLDTPTKTESLPLNQPKLLSSDLNSYKSGSLNAYTIPVWFKYLMWFIIFVCLIYIIKPFLYKNIKPAAPPVSSTAVLATNNDTARNTFNSMFKMLDSDLHTWHVDKNPSSILELNANILSYKKMISDVKPTECMSLPYRRMNIGLDAYIVAGNVLRNGLRNVPVEFNKYVTNISREKIEDNNEFTARMRLRLDLSAGHSTEPSYIAHRLTVFGTTMMNYGRETMRGC